MMRFRGIAAFALIAALSAGCTSSTTTGRPTAAPTPTHLGSTSNTPTTRPPTTSKPPTTSPPAVPTTGPNVRPGEKPPTLPALASKHSPAGADVFAEFWIETWDWAFATTDATLMNEYYAKSCTDCARAASEFPSLQRRREHIIGGRLFFRKSMLIYGAHKYGAEIAVDVTFGQYKSRLVDSDGKVVQRDPMVNRITFRLWLRWTGRLWTIVQKGHVT